MLRHIVGLNRQLSERVTLLAKELENWCQAVAFKAPSSGENSVEEQSERRHCEHKALEIQEPSVTRVPALEMQMRTLCRVLVSCFVFRRDIMVSFFFFFPPRQMHNLKD